MERLLISIFSAPLATRKVQTASTALENTALAQLFRFSVRNHCSNVLRSHWALEITARACFEATWRSKSLLEHDSFVLQNHFRACFFFSFESTFVFHSKSLSKSLCFELCIASSCTSCDFTGAVRRHIYIYIYIYIMDTWCWSIREHSSPHADTRGS